MAVVVDGPILTGFKRTLALQSKPLAADSEACSLQVIEKLGGGTSNTHPGMLLGKIQSGKTRAFVAATAIAFDNGYQSCIILTKPTKALATQTFKRLSGDLHSSIDQNLLRIFDALHLPDQLTEWERSQVKSLFVCKKERRNFLKLLNLFVKYPDMAGKRILIIDDEADFASIGYHRVNGVIDARVIPSYIDDLRKSLTDASFLEVTATPYALYLQPPDEITIPANQRVFRPIRPSFTVTVPQHSGYVGGQFYFEQATKMGSVASFVYSPVTDTELQALKSLQTQMLKSDLISSPDISTLRRAIVNFVVGGVIRKFHQTKVGGVQKLLTFIVHTETKKDAHAWQSKLVMRLIEQLQTEAAAKTAKSKTLVKEAYDDLSRSVIAAKLDLPTLADVLKEAPAAFAGIAVERVNSDREVTALLDERGELRRRSPYNVFIGGQVLDRGITIADVVGFYYGRSPKTSQQDTTLQHCRMYGAREKADLAVTRFYTTPVIRARMLRMHQLDVALWEQVAKTNRDVVFLEVAARGEVRACSPNKILISRVVTLRPGGEYLPYPMTTVSENGENPGCAKVRSFVRRLTNYVDGNEFDITVAEAVEFLNLCSKLVTIDEPYVFDWEAMKAAIEHLAQEAASDLVHFRFKEGYSIEKWKGPDETDPQRSPYSTTIERRMRQTAGLRPALDVYGNLGLSDKGWRDSPFFWPVLYIPDQVLPMVFSAGTRRSRRK